MTLKESIQLGVVLLGIDRMPICFVVTQEELRHILAVSYGESNQLMVSYKSQVYYIPLEQLKTPLMLLQAVPLLQLNLFRRLRSICKDGTKDNGLSMIVKLSWRQVSIKTEGQILDMPHRLPISGHNLKWAKNESC